MDSLSLLSAKSYLSYGWNGYDLIYFMAYGAVDLVVVIIIIISRCRIDLHNGRRLVPGWSI